MEIDELEFDWVWRTDCTCCHINKALAFVSKQVSQEFLEIVYRSNIFQVCQSFPNGLDSLHRMSDASLSNIRRLSIRLEPGHRQEVDGYWYEELKVPSPIDIRTKQGQIAASDWASLVGKLARVVRRRNLQLSVVFTAVDLDSATSILRPMEQLPALLKCGIWVILISQKNWIQINRSGLPTGCLARYH